MADDQDQTQGRSGLKRPAQETANRSTKRKKPKCLPSKTKRARVAIGFAIERWRAMKEEHGLKSDAEVAVFLLDLMKNRPSNSASPEAKNEKLKFSRTEVENLIKQEVSRKVKKNKTKLLDLIDTIRQLEGEVDYERCIQKLEARIKTVTQRAETVLAHMEEEKKKSQLLSTTHVGINRSHSEDEIMEVVPQNEQNTKSTDTIGDVCQTMKTTKEELKKIQTDSKALMAAIEDLSAESPSADLTPSGSADSKGSLAIVKKEPQNSEDNKDKSGASMQLEEPVAEEVKECFYPRKNPKHKDSNKDKPLYPPLPPTTFPSVLNVEAASYNIPQRLEVRLALIRNPASLSVLWNVSEKDQYAPPMDSYSVLMTMEKVKGSDLFSKWSSIGEVTAIPLPICVMISKYRPGHKVGVAVVGKDKFGRYGPYSKVVTATIPD